MSELHRAAALKEQLMKEAASGSPQHAPSPTSFSESNKSPLLSGSPGPTNNRPFHPLLEAMHRMQRPFQIPQQATQQQQMMNHLAAMAAAAAAGQRQPVTNPLAAAAGLFPPTPTCNRPWLQLLQEKSSNSSKPSL